MKKLNIAERIALLSFCPERGSYEEMMLTTALGGKVSLTDKEAEMYLVKGENERFSIRPSGLVDTVEIDLSSEEEEFIVGRLKGLQEAKAISVDLLSLYSLFLLS